MVNVKKRKRAVQKELPSAVFDRTKPKFLDWEPLTPEELLLEAQTRRAERDAQLRIVTELERAKQAKKKSGKNIGEETAKNNK
jgi:hypothetical protein